MAKSSLPPSGEMLRFSIRDLNPPIISFVGRLDASQKGFDVFLDAVELLERTDMPPFSAWLVGGSTAEVGELVTRFAERPYIARMHASGRLMVWGRVDLECLPEIYSRSALVIMPSRRETFGLVAVEAMLCEAPVLGSYVGGLKHTVLHGWTGGHFAVGDAGALAFLAQSLICNRRLAAWLGGNARIWATEAFGLESPNAGFNRILRAQESGPVGTHPIENADNPFQRSDAEAVAEWLGRDSTIEPISVKNNATFQVTSPAGARWFVKAFTRRIDYDLSVYRLDPSVVPVDWQARYHRTVVAAGSPATLPMIDGNDRLARFAWAEPFPDEKVLDAIALVRTLGEGLPPAPVGAEVTCRRACQDFVRSGSWSDLAEFDRAAALLNAPLTGSDRIFVRCDPGIEIGRLQLHLATRCWPIDDDTRTAMEEVLDHTAALKADRSKGFDERPSDPGPALAVRHGNMTFEHVMRCGDRMVLCDLEETRFAFGDLDVAGLLLDGLRTRRFSESPFDRAIHILRDTQRDQDAVRSTLSWFVAQAFHLALGKASWGRPEALREATSLCRQMLSTAYL